MALAAAAVCLSACAEKSPIEPVFLTPTPVPGTTLTPTVTPTPAVSPSPTATTTPTATPPF